jgi:hypothetical protein
MSDFKILTEAPSWYLFICVLVAVGYAALLYSAKAPWGVWWNRGLAAVRFTLVLILCLLLLNPFLRMVFNTEDKPVVVLAADNSASIPAMLGKEKAKAEWDVLKTASAALSEKVELGFATFNGIGNTLPDTVQPYAQTNINTLLNQIATGYEGKNLAGIVLYSDGIITEGISPENSSFPFPIVCIGTGDTTQKKDVAISGLAYNDIVYAGSKFPLEVSLKQYGFNNTEALVQVLENGSVLTEKRTPLSSSSLTKLTFLLDAGKPGLRALQVRVSPLTGEFSIKNNTANAYLEVIDGKQKVLIIAAAPHPDIKAFRGALEQAQNYEVDVVMPGIGKLNPAMPYDLVIAHNLPDRFNSFGPELNQLLEKSNAVLYVIGRQTSLPSFNAINGLYQVLSIGGNPDKVGGQIESGFNSFLFNTDAQTTLDRLPPLEAVYGEYKPLAQAEVLLYQKVGNSVTSKPLLSFGIINGKKVGLLAGEGLWNWYVQEYAINQNHDVLNNLIRKSVQYLSTKADKRRLRVRTINREFLAGDKVQFSIETYNEIYERVANIPVSITITSAPGKPIKLNFISSDANNLSDAGALPAGVYNFSAEATIGKSKEKVSGQFVVKEMDVELRNLTANHQMLRELAKKTGGAFFTAANTKEAMDYFVKNSPKSIIRSEESNKELISLAWVFFLLVGLATIEWLSRKLNSGL